MMPHHVVDRGQSPYRPSEGYGVSQPAREVKGRALKPPLQAHLEAEAFSREMSSDGRGTDVFFGENTQLDQWSETWFP
eukprot:symbB.v1.2.000073.t1/scaffold2.1/size812218/27